MAASLGRLPEGTFPGLEVTAGGRREPSRHALSKDGSPQHVYAFKFLGVILYPELA